MWTHVKMCRDHCVYMEKLLESASHSTSSAASRFTVIIGDRSSQGRSEVNSTITSPSKPFSPNTSPSIAPSNVGSYDGTMLSRITSAATTPHQPSSH